jgi:hypothetical protein
MGDGFDNGLTEGFIATLPTSLLDRHTWTIREQLAKAVFRYQESFCNPRRGPRPPRSATSARPTTKPPDTVRGPGGTPGSSHHQLWGRPPPRKAAPQLDVTSTSTVSAYWSSIRSTNRRSASASAAGASIATKWPAPSI